MAEKAVKWARHAATWDSRKARGCAFYGSQTDFCRNYGTSLLQCATSFRPLSCLLSHTSPVAKMSWSSSVLSSVENVWVADVGLTAVVVLGAAADWSGVDSMNIEREEPAEEPMFDDSFETPVVDDWDERCAVPAGKTRVEKVAVAPATMTLEKAQRRESKQEKGKKQKKKQEKKDEDEEAAEAEGDETAKPPPKKKFKKA